MIVFTSSWDSAWILTATYCISLVLPNKMKISYLTSFQNLKIMCIPYAAYMERSSLVDSSSLLANKIKFFQIFFKSIKISCISKNWKIKKLQKCLFFKYCPTLNKFLPTIINSSSFWSISVKIRLYLFTCKYKCQNRATMVSV